MRSFTRLLFLCAIALVATIIQEFHLIAINGVTPNLLLVLFVVLIVLREPVGILGSLGIALCILAFVHASFWLVPFLILGAVIICLFFLSRVLTGSRYADALLLVFVGTLVFSVIGALGAGAPFPWSGVGIELVLNLTAAGIAALLVFRNAPNVR